MTNDSSVHSASGAPEDTKDIGGEPVVSAQELQAADRFPATRTVHWPSGPVHACDMHASQLVGLSRFLGAHVGVTTAPDRSVCENCKNSAAISTASK